MRAKKELHSLLDFLIIHRSVFAGSFGALIGDTDNGDMLHIPDAQEQVSFTGHANDSGGPILSNDFTGQFATGHGINETLISIGDRNDLLLDGAPQATGHQDQDLATRDLSLTGTDQRITHFDK